MFPPKKMENDVGLSSDIVAFSTKFSKALKDGIVVSTVSGSEVELTHQYNLSNEITISAGLKVFMNQMFLVCTFLHPSNHSKKIH